jgi:hypothetical protein
MSTRAVLGIDELTMLDRRRDASAIPSLPGATVYRRSPDELRW